MDRKVVVDLTPEEKIWLKVFDPAAYQLVYERDFRMNDCNMKPLGIVKCAIPDHGFEMPDGRNLMYALEGYVPLNPDWAQKPYDGGYVMLFIPFNIDDMEKCLHKRFLTRGALLRYHEAIKGTGINMLSDYKCCN